MAEELSEREKRQMLFGYPDPKTWQPMDWQEGPYIYHGTDSESTKSIQREGMNTGPSMDLSTDTEPFKRLWFARNVDHAQGFAGRRIHAYTGRLANRELRERGVLKPRDEMTPQDEEVYWETRGRIDKEREHIYEIVLRLRTENIPEDCDIDEPEFQVGELTPEGPVERMAKPYVILDNCEIPPTLLEVCNLGEAVPLTSAT